MALLDRPGLHQEHRRVEELRVVQEPLGPEQLGLSAVVVPEHVQEIGPRVELVVPGRDPPPTADHPVRLGQLRGVPPVRRVGVGVGVLQDQEGLRPDRPLEHPAQGRAAGHAREVDGQLHRRVSDPHVVDVARGDEDRVLPSPSSGPDRGLERMVEGAAAELAELGALLVGEEAARGIFFLGSG